MRIDGLRYQIHRVALWSMREGLLREQLYLCSAFGCCLNVLLAIVVACPAAPDFAVDVSIHGREVSGSDGRDGTGIM